MGRFVLVPVDLIRDPSLSHSELRVWCFVMSNREDFVYTVDFACKCMGMDKRTWHKCIRSLELKGLVEVMQGSFRQRNRYKAVIPKIDDG